MTKENFDLLVKNAIEECCPKIGLSRWDEPRWQRVLMNMYNQFSSYTVEQQEAMVNRMGPKEPFWDRAVMDAVFTYYML